MYTEYFFLKLNHKLRFHQCDYSKQSHKDGGKVWVPHLKMSMADSSLENSDDLFVESAFEDCWLLMADLKVSQITEFLFVETPKGVKNKWKNLL
jgi:hypothetical protein